MSFKYLNSIVAEWIKPQTILLDSATNTNLSPKCSTFNPIPSKAPGRIVKDDLNPWTLYLLALSSGFPTVPGPVLAFVAVWRAN